MDFCMSIDEIFDSFSDGLGDYTPDLDKLAYLGIELFMAHTGEIKEDDKLTTNKFDQNIKYNADILTSRNLTDPYFMKDPPKITVFNPVATEDYVPQLIASRANSMAVVDVSQRIPDIMNLLEQEKGLPCSVLPSREFPDLRQFNGYGFLDVPFVGTTDDIPLTYAIKVISKTLLSDNILRLEEKKKR
jgi:hypothetical protein